MIRLKNFTLFVELRKYIYIYSLKEEEGEEMYKNIFFSLIQFMPGVEQVNPSPVLKNTS